MPDSLREFQIAWRKGVSAPLRLDGEGGAAVPVEDYPPELLAAVRPDLGIGTVARLGAYRSQYWFRLICLLQEEFPLACRVAGWVDFDVLAEAFLREHPAGKSLTEIGSRFPDWLRRRRTKKEIVEASRVDAAWNRAFHAPRLELPSEADLPGILEGSVGLVLQPSVQVLEVELDWIGARQRLIDAASDEVALPPRLGGVAVLSKMDDLFLVETVEADLARFLSSLRRGGSWLGCLEAMVSRKPALLDAVPGWFATGVRLGWWGVSPI